jgi:hypothetical protein
VVLLNEPAEFIVDVDPERADGMVSTTMLRGRTVVSGDDSIALNPNQTAVVAAGKGPVAFTTLLPHSVDTDHGALQRIATAFLPA